MDIGEKAATGRSHEARCCLSRHQRDSGLSWAFGVAHPHIQQDYYWQLSTATFVVAAKKSAELKDVSETNEVESVENDDPLV